MKLHWAVRALPASALVMAMGLATGCSGDGKNSLTDCDMQGKIDALGASVDSLVSVSAEMRLKLAVACAALGGGKFTKSAATDDEVNTACGTAKTAIMANFTGDVSFTFVPGKCEVNAEAQLSCDASCNVEAECTPGTVEARCEPGNLSVECSGECTGTLTCEASASGSVECEGQCNGSCTGTCSGTCNGTCDGKCDVMGADGKCAGSCDGMCEGSCSASCGGTCKGSCTYDAKATAKCDATARCEGTCSVEGTAPKCEGTLEPPSCKKPDVDCQAACKGQANFDAKCTPPTVVLTGTADADFAAAFEANMPTVLEVSAQAKLALEAAADVSNAGTNVVEAAADVPACALKVVGQIGARFEAAANAAVSVQASVSVSASVSGSASSK